MRIKKTKFDGVFLITPNIIKDKRGYFFESFRNDSFSQSSIPTKFAQEINYAISIDSIIKQINESTKLEIKKMLKIYSHKDVVEFISKKENLPKKMIYNFCLKIIK